MDTCPRPSRFSPNETVLTIAFVLAHLMCLPANAQVSSEVLDSISTPNQVETSLGTLEFLDGARLPVRGGMITPDGAICHKALYRPSEKGRFFFLP